jgi:hypothetical protein
LVEKSTLYSFTLPNENKKRQNLRLDHVFGSIAKTICGIISRLSFTISVGVPFIIIISAPNGMLNWLLLTRIFPAKTLMGME